MTCPKCIRDPFAHSFSYFGKAGGGDISLYYTAPARVTARDNYDGIVTFQRHIQEIKGSWIWVIDCANMELHNFYTMRFCSIFSDILMTEWELRQVVILHPNLWIYRVLHNIPYEAADVIRVCSNNVELSGACTELGFSYDARTWLQITCTRDPNEKLEEVPLV